MYKGPVYQEDTARCIFACHSGSRAFNAKEMENIAPPFLRRSGWVRWACLATFFLALGLGEEPAFRGLQAWGFPAGQSSRRGWCTGTSPRLIHCMHACVSTETRSLLHGPHHHHHHHHLRSHFAQEQSRSKRAVKQFSLSVSEGWFASCYVSWQWCWGWLAAVGWSSGPRLVVVVLCLSFVCHRWCFSGRNSILLVRLCPFRSL